MSKLDEIEAIMDQTIWTVPAALSRENVFLLIRAVRQLGAKVKTADMVSGSDKIDWGLGLKALRREIASIDPDVLELIANLEQGANEQEG